MARLLDDATGDYLSVDSVPVSAAPLTMVCWGKTNDLSIFQGLMSLHNDPTTNHVFALSSAYSVFAARARARDGTGSGDATVGTLADNNWHFFGARFSSSTSREAFFDGAKSGIDTTDRTPSVSKMWLGNYGGDSWSGAMAECAVWNAALDDAEMEALRLRYCPKLVRPGKLVSYTSLIRDDDVDEITGLSFTVNGTPGIADHPPIIYPAPKVYSFAAAGAPPGNAIPMAVNHYRRRRAG